MYGTIKCERKFVKIRLTTYLCSKLKVIYTRCVHSSPVHSCRMSKMVLNSHDA